MIRPRAISLKKRLFVKIETLSELKTDSTTIVSRSGHKFGDCHHAIVSDQTIIHFFVDCSTSQKLNKQHEWFTGHAKLLLQMHRNILLQCS